MAQFPPILLTNKGKQMIAEASATKSALIFTKCALGDGNLDGTVIDTMTDIKHLCMTSPLTSATADGKGTSTLHFTVSNKGLEKGFFCREVGIFAKVGDGGAESLFAYANAGNLVDYIPDKTNPIDEQIMNVILTTESATKVAVVVNESLVYITLKDLAVHNADPSAHANLVANLKDLLSAHNISPEAHADIRSLIKSLTTLVGQGGIIASNLAKNGWAKFANGLILQWGTVTGVCGSHAKTYTYPISFAQNVFIIRGNTNNKEWDMLFCQKDLKSFTAGYWDNSAGNDEALENSGEWVAIGN